MCDFFKQIKQLNNKNISHHNKIICKYGEKIINSNNPAYISQLYYKGDYIENRVVNEEIVNHTFGNKGEIEFVINTKKTFVHKIKNIKVDKWLLDNFATIYFMNNGCKMETIRSDTINVLRCLYHMKDNELPFYFFINGILSTYYHIMKIVFVMKPGQTNIPKKLNLYYDRYDIDNIIDFYEKNEIKIVFQLDTPWTYHKGNCYSYDNEDNCLICRDYDLNNNRTTYGCILPRVVYYICIKTNYMGNVYLDLMFSTDNREYLKLYLYKRIDGINIYSLTKSLKLEDIMKYGLSFGICEVNITMDGNIQIGGIFLIHSDILIWGSGMSGMVFSS